MQRLSSPGSQGNDLLHKYSFDIIHMTNIYVALGCLTLFYAGLSCASFYAFTHDASTVMSDAMGFSFVLRWLAGRTAAEQASGGGTKKCEAEAVIGKPLRSVDETDALQYWHIYYSVR